MDTLKKSTLQIFEDKINGGFESLTQTQIAKIKGGQKDADMNAVCTNENDCTKSSNPGSCNNTGNC